MKNKVVGITLIELIMTMSLGLIISGSALHFFLVIKQVLQIQMGLARIQENGRIVNSLLGLPIQEAGNIGCNAFGENIVFRPHDGIDVENYGLILTEPVVGLHKDELSKNSLISKKMVERAISHNDIIWIKSVSKRYKIFKKKKDRSALYIRGSIALKPYQIFFISTCSQVQAFKAKDKVEMSGVNSLGKIHFYNPKRLHIIKAAKTSLELGIFSSKLFYIGKTLRLNSSGDPISALYSTDLNGRTIELIEGVERMKILYGVKNADRVSYVSAEEVDNWNKVFLVRVSLLLNSVEAAYQSPEKYFHDNEEILPKDRLMRKWWVYEWPIKSIA